MRYSCDGTENGLAIYDGGVDNRPEDTIMLLPGLELAGDFKFDLYISDTSFRRIVVVRY